MEFQKICLVLSSLMDGYHHRSGTTTKITKTEDVILKAAEDDMYSVEQTSSSDEGVIFADARVRCHRISSFRHTHRIDKPEYSWGGSEVDPRGEVA